MIAHYMMEKRQYDCRGVHDMSIYEKNVTVDFYIVCSAVVRDKDIKSYIIYISKIKQLMLNNLLRFMMKMIYIICDISIPHNST